MVAVNDGVITEIGKSKRLGRYLVLRDAYGNRFTYAKLGKVSEVYPVQKRKRLSAADFELVSPDDPKPEQAASAGSNDRGSDESVTARAEAGARAATARSTPRTRASASMRSPSAPTTWSAPTSAASSTR